MLASHNAPIPCWRGDIFPLSFELCIKRKGSWASKFTVRVHKAKFFCVSVSKSACVCVWGASDLPTLSKNVTNVVLTAWRAMESENADCRQADAALIMSEETLSSSSAGSPSLPGPITTKCRPSFRSQLPNQAEGQQLIIGQWPNHRGCSFCLCLLLVCMLKNIKSCSEWTRAEIKR